MDRVSNIGNRVFSRFPNESGKTPRGVGEHIAYLTDHAQLARVSGTDKSEKALMVDCRLYKHLADTHGAKYVTDALGFLRRGEVDHVVVNEWINYGSVGENGLKEFHAIQEGYPDQRENLENALRRWTETQN